MNKFSSRLIHRNKTVLTSGDYAGLVIEQSWHRNLEGLKAIRVTHHKVASFEARALVAETMTIDEIFSEVKKIRLNG